MPVRGVTLPALALFLATAGTAVAEEEKVNDNIDCGYPLTEAERSFCADKALEDADTRMKEAFDRLRARLVEIDAELPEHLKGAPPASMMPRPPGKPTPTRIAPPTASPSGAAHAATNCTGTA